MTDFLFLEFLNDREEFDKHQSNERRRVRLNSSVYDHTTSFTESPPFSDRLSAIGSSSPRCGENGSIYNRRTISPESSDSFNEVPEDPGSNVSGCPYSTEPETTGAVCASDTAQIQTSTSLSSSVRVLGCCTSDSDADLSRMNSWANIPLVEPAPFQGLQSDALYDPRFNAQPFDPLYDPRFDAQPFDPFYNLGFHVQPVDVLYDPRFNAQPFDPLVQPVSDPQLAVQSGHVDHPSPHMQQVTELGGI